MGRAGSQKFRTRAHRLAHPDPDPSGNRRTRGLRIRGRRPSAVCRQNLCTHDRGQSPEAFRPCIRARNRPWTRTGYPGIPDRNRPTASANPCSRPRTNPKDHENLYTHAPNPPLTQTGHPGIPDRNHPTASENPCSRPRTNPKDHENLCTRAANRPRTRTASPGTRPRSSPASENPCSHPRTNPTDHENLCTRAANRPRTRTASPGTRPRSSPACLNLCTHARIRRPMTVSRNPCSLRARNSRRHHQNPCTHARPHYGNRQRYVSSGSGRAKRRLPPWNHASPFPDGQDYSVCHEIRSPAWSANGHRRPDAMRPGSEAARRIPSMSVSACRQA